MRRPAGAVLMILFATVLAYVPALQADFVELDDPLYLLHNRMVRTGLTVEGVRWAFTTTRGALWMPLAWLAHMLDVQLFGLVPVGHHLTSLLIHLANTVLVFVVLRRLTGAESRSAFVAALFALHPLRVESVAWVAERKDVLSTFFVLVTIWSYTGFVRRPGPGRYAAVMASYAMALLAKPMVITLPFALLLLDHWPLRRLGQVRRCVVEKLPLVAMALGTLAVAIRAGANGNAVAAWEAWPLEARLVNAATSIVIYLRRVFWPDDLAAYYPLPRSWSVAQLIVTAVILGGISIVSLALARRRAYLGVGWLWFVGTLVPALGIVQAGSQGMADRFTYVPLIGVFVALTWAAADIGTQLRIPRHATRGVGIALLVMMAAATRQQAGYWRNSVTLFERALAVTRENWFVHDNLGTVLLRQGRVADAAAHFNEALRIEPRNARAVAHLATVELASGRVEEGITGYERALALEPTFTDARNDLGLAYLRAGRADDAVRELRRAVAERPEASMRFNLGLALERQGNLGAALGEYSEALRLDAAMAVARERRDAVIEQLATAAGTHPADPATTRR